MQRLRLVIPVYNDWISFHILLRELDDVAAELPVRIAISVVDDGSTHGPEGELQDVPGLRNLEAVEIIHLYSNVGHQRAIAIGMATAAEDDNFDAVLVMDADGEDSPRAIAKLLAMAGDRQDFCVVARRRRRSENFTFRLAYVLYKFAFRMLTGRQIAFGNFSLFSRSYVRRLVRVSDLWNNLPAAVLRSRLPIQALPVDRARRYAGKSKMNLTSLVVHGFSGISVYAETIFVRLLFLTMVLASMSGILITVVMSLRLFLPRFATPGWATTVSFGMVILLVQVLSVTLSSILMLLNSRVQRLIVPLVDYKCFVDYREQILNSVKERLPVFEPAPLPLWEKLA
jgi:glycosyltransferase involved in cell wall biosynthesis